MKQLRDLTTTESDEMLGEILDRVGAIARSHRDIFSTLGCSPGCGFCVVARVFDAHGMTDTMLETASDDGVETADDLHQLAERLGVERNYP